MRPFWKWVFGTRGNRYGEAVPATVSKADNPYNGMTIHIAKLENGHVISLAKPYDHRFPQTTNETLYRVVHPSEDIHDAIKIMLVRAQL